MQTSLSSLFQHKASCEKTQCKQESKGKEQAMKQRRKKREKVFSEDYMKKEQKEGAFNNRWTVFLNQVPNIKHLASFSTRPLIGTKQFQHNTVGIGR